MSEALRTAGMHAVLLVCLTLLSMYSYITASPLTILTPELLRRAAFLSLVASVGGWFVFMMALSAWRLAREPVDLGVTD